MKTPKAYTDMVKKREITKDVMAQCIYSVNKRAKNSRDKIQEIKERRFYQYNHQNIETEREKKEMYYDYKETLLSAFKPSVIHRQYVGDETIRVYSFEKEYKSLHKEKKEAIVHEGCYFDYDRVREVDFFDYKTGRDKYLYFYYYEIANNTFHSPIGEKTALEQQTLEIIDIDDNFTTYGKDYRELLSVQFVKKVIALIESGDYTIID